MLKIKDGVNWKELEKFGFEDFGTCYKAYALFGTQFFIDKETRKITRLHPYDTRELPTKGEINNLIDEGLVEEVEV